MKRLLTILLALAMVAALAVPALADAEPEIEESELRPEIVLPAEEQPEPYDAVLDPPPVEVQDSEYPGGAAGTVGEEPPMPGGALPAADKYMTDELQDIIDLATEDLWDENIFYVGRGLLSTQVVSGMNYTFVANRYVMHEDYSFDTTYVILTVYQDLEGNCQITDEQEITFAEARELLGFHPLHPGVGDEPWVWVRFDGADADVVNNEGLYIRIAMSIRIGDNTGLYICQGVADEEGTVEFPLRDDPSVTITGVSVALVPTVADITSPNPTVLASDWVLLDDEEYPDFDWRDLLPSWLRNLDIGRIIEWLRSLTPDAIDGLDPEVIEGAVNEAPDSLRDQLGYWIIKHS